MTRIAILFAALAFTLIAPDSRADDGASFSSQFEACRSEAENLLFRERRSILVS